MNITSVASPIYSKADNSSINCQATFDDGNTYPYTSNAADTMPYGIQLWADLNAGVYGAISPYMVPST